VAAPADCLGQEQCQSSVVVLDASGLNATQVYEAGSGIGRPAWSPDGAHLAFMVGASRTAVPGTVHVIGTDGTGPRTLGEGFGDPTWTDGGAAVAWARIVMSGGPTYGSLFATSLADATTKWLAEGLDLAVADDSDSLVPAAAFAIVARGEEPDAVPPDGLPASDGSAPVKEVTPFEPDEGARADPAPRWRGLGTFMDCRPGEVDLKARTLTEYEASLGLPSSCRGVAWSPDGTAFLAVSDAGVVRVLVPGSNTHALSAELGEVDGIAVSPRGTYVAVQACPKASTCDGSETTIVRLHGGDITGLLVGSPIAWSPDERRLALDSPHGLAVAGGDGTGFVPVPGIDRQITWSPDGSHFAFVEDGNVQVAAWDGSDRHALTKFPLGGATNVWWSPRGDRLAVFQGRRSVLIVTADGTPVARVALQGRVFGWALVWAPDGSRFVVGARLYEGPHLVVVATDGSRAVDLQNADQPLFSPDSRFLAYLTGVESGDLEMTIANADGSGAWSIPDPNGHLPGAWLEATLTP
jgi:dipeptidyl aminopeptidase/acylaminoacyl peptidase